jgi:prepilin-type N-terminal cleavage/methylation domain-containing protein
MKSLFGSIQTSDVSRRQAGFSLVELMVVITIIGVLAGIAVPRFQTFRARSQQAEAKSGLNGLYLSMQAFQTNYNSFCVSEAGGTCNNNAAADPVATGRLVAMDGIGFRTGGGQTRYQYALISDVGAWAAIASSNAAMNGPNFDFLRINTNKLVCNPFDAVTGLAATPAWTADCQLGNTANGCQDMP